MHGEALCNLLPIYIYDADSNNFISYSELLFVIKLFHILLPSCPVQRVHIEIGMGFFNMFIRCLNWSAATEAFLDSRDHAVGP